MEKINIPTAIIVGAIIISIGLGIGLTGQKGNGESATFAQQLEQYQQEQQEAQIEAQRQEEEETKKLVENVLPVDGQDHIRGSKNPKITIVEYSDYECPFCKRFHDTMKEVIDDYGDDVAWVYRHWPIEGLHPVKARREALAAECAADQKGSDGFWEFSDRFMELTPSNNRTELDTVLPQIADEMGLSRSKFLDCIDSEKFAEKVDRDTQNALATGGSGTPWSIIVLPDGTKIPLNGAQPAEAISKLIDSVLEQE